MPLSMPCAILALPSPRALAILAMLGLVPSAAAAQNVIAQNTTISDALCVGTDCLATETYGSDTIRLKGVNNRIHMDDVSSATNPANDWRLVFNDATDIASGGQSYFGLEDVTGGAMPFRVEAGAPANALYVDDQGKVGIGTMFPIEDMHIEGGAQAAIRMRAATTSAGLREFQVNVNETGFGIFDAGNGTFPFVITPATPGNALQLNPGNVVVNNALADVDFTVRSNDGTSLIATDAANNRVGLGTNTPEGTLHVKGDGVQLSYLESGDGGPVQLRFRTDSQNRRFLAVNNANEVKSQIIFLDDRINFTGTTDSGADLWLSIGSNGILSQGGTCNVTPCDRTFDPEVFTVPPIDERAEYMWENMHLPAVGPTVAGEPINLTEKTTGMLHELEVAHIFIEQLHGQIAEEKAATDTRFDEQDKRAQHQNDQLIRQLAVQQAMLDLQRAELDAIKAMLAEQ